MNLSAIQKVHQTSEDTGNHVFSLIIPSWNNLDYLKLCVRSIRQNSTYRHQIILVINEGKDGSLDWAQQQNDIDYVFSPENLGICYGLNVCRSLVHTPYIVYVNDDMYMLPGWDDALLKEVKALGHAAFMLSSTMIEPYDNKNTCGLVKNFGDSLENFEEERLLKEFRELEKPDWSGSTWPPVLVHVDMWDLVGGMSAEFSPGMYSDPDLSMKLWQAGVRYFKGLGNSRVYHFGSKSTKRVKRNRGRNTFLQKYGVTSNFFVKYFLRRGKRFSGPLTKPSFPFYSNILHKLKLFVILFRIN